LDEAEEKLEGNVFILGM